MRSLRACRWACASCTPSSSSMRPVQQPRRLASISANLAFPPLPVPLLLRLRTAGNTPPSSHCTADTVGLPVATPVVHKQPIEDMVALILGSKLCMPTKIPCKQELRVHHSADTAQQKERTPVVKVV